MKQTIVLASAPTEKKNSCGLIAISLTSTIVVSQKKSHLFVLFRHLRSIFSQFRHYVSHRFEW